MQPPIRIPGVETEGELGRGAYSVVFRGKHGETPCAVKVPRWRGRSHQWFRREAVALARVNDPGLPSVMEVGEADDVPYLVMELAEGEPLSERLRRGPLSDDEALDLALQLCRTLSAVHRRGLVHRDVKPSNIVIETTTGLVRLVDFGFVTQIGRPQEAVAGTREYAPPEQMTAPQSVGTRADLYSLGVVLYECLTGHRPSRAEEGAEPPVARLGLARQGRVGPGLAQVVQGLLAPEASERYPAVAPVLRDLERVQAGLEPLGPSAHVSAEPARLPLVGRDAELEDLSRRWREASQGKGAVLLLEGQPGSGKSRLLAGLVDRIRGSNVLFAQCAEGDPTPLAALRRLFDGYLDGLVGLSSGEHEAAERALRDAGSDQLARLVALVSPRLADTLGHPEIVAPARDLHEAFVETMAEFMQRFVRAVGPILLCIDDLQWADPVSRAVIVQLAHRSADLPLLLVATARDDEASRQAVDRFRDSLGTERLSTMRLGRLGAPAMKAMVSAYLGTDAVDPVLVHRIVSLSDGTPLSVLEILEAFVDHGVLAPHWGGWRFDAEAAERMLLPGTASDILRRRIDDLPPASRHVLEVGAVLGTVFDDALLAQVTAVDPDDLGYATAEVRRAGLIEDAGRGCHRFVHDRVREALLSSLSADAQRKIHARIARVLDASNDARSERIYEVATHYALGGPETDAFRTFECCRGAAVKAGARFDHETALRFFDWASKAAVRAGVTPGPSFLRLLGETRLRVGALQESLDALQEALDAVSDPLDQAEILGRLAWVHQMRADPDRAWATLERAFRELGATLPEEDVGSVSRSLVAWVRAQARSRYARTPHLGKTQRRKLEVLCTLHYQNARLGLEYGRVLRFLQSTLRVLDVAWQLGPSPTLAKSYAMYGFAMTALGRTTVGLGYLDRGQAMAEQVDDPLMTTYCRQLQTTARYWTGEFELASQMSRSLLRDFGHWLEASEYCMLSDSPRSVEAMRGRPLYEWQWADSAVERIRRSGRAPAAFLVTERAVRAALTALGREAEIPMFEERMRFVERSTAAEEGFFGLLSWGARIRAFTECGNLGEAFEREVAAFEAQGHNAARAHAGLFEYYAHVAHARAHQCLRAGPSEQAHRLAQLGKAVDDLERAARVPVLRAHVEALRGYQCWLIGSANKARNHFERAERIAERENAPWVLYAVARGEAHMLLAEGHREAARERARIAALLAREHGAAHRLRWIGEEFDLRTSSPPPPRSSRSELRGSSSSRRRRQLQTLLHVVRASSRDLHLDQQAKAVLDELVQTFGADRGLLAYESEPGETLRTRSGAARVGPGHGAADPAVRRVQETGEPWIGGPLPAGASDDSQETGHVLAAPLVLKERIVGAVSLERDRLDSPFTSDDRDLLVALSYQVLSALELTRLLEQRERLEDSLRQAQKMEAVGRLAGGIAHDFNNMLTVIEASVEALRGRNQAQVEGDTQPDLEMIEDAAQRAKTLTRQLLAFSRRQVVHPQVHAPNVVLSELAPMLRRLIGEHIKVDLKLDEHAHPVKVDRSFFEQAIVNLAANARDAMPKGGTLTLKTQNVEFDAAFARAHVGTQAGPHVLVTVGDTGEGMPPDVQARIFDPFFTTKQLSGTGLGLSTVYGFVTQSHGHIEVESDLGCGTRFHLYLPKTPEALRRPSAPAPTAGQRGGTETVLLVEDEQLVRNSVRRILQRSGYHVLTAEGGHEALALAERHGTQIALVITDVLMPDMSGPELVECLEDRLPNAKVLYMSGYTDGHLVAHGVLERGVSLLHKPFTSGELKQRLRELLDEA